MDENWTVKVADFGLSHIKKHETPGKGGSYGSIGSMYFEKNPEFDLYLFIYLFFSSTFMDGS